ncbi:hypothetical protein PCL1606_22810 [Pseudomonas chlororaphis]|uniref:Uncharacterized protein n=1 Tax=Pseudomonas chlororaphis TaxID=587753 RepID=A0A0D5XXC7_9PSED|nr:hypothetical protein PCL1606_22810 [Pseudomonas chlororaphis]
MQGCVRQVGERCEVHSWAGTGAGKECITVGFWRTTAGSLSASRALSRASLAPTDPCNL